MSEYMLITPVHVLVGIVAKRDCGICISTETQNIDGCGYLLSIAIIRG